MDKELEDKVGDGNAVEFLDGLDTGCPAIKESMLEWLDRLEEQYLWEDMMCIRLNAERLTEIYKQYPSLLLYIQESVEETANLLENLVAWCDKKLNN